MEYGGVQITCPQRRRFDERPSLDAIVGRRFDRTARNSHGASRRAVQDRPRERSEFVPRSARQARRGQPHEPTRCAGFGARDACARDHETRVRGYERAVLRFRRLLAMADVLRSPSSPRTALIPNDLVRSNSAEKCSSLRDFFRGLPRSNGERQVRRNDCEELAELAERRLGSTLLVTRVGVSARGPELFRDIGE